MENYVNNSYVEPLFYQVTLTIPIILSLFIICSWIICIVARKHANEHLTYVVTSYDINDGTNLDNLPFAKRTIKKDHKYDMVGIYLLPSCVTFVVFLMFMFFYRNLLPQYTIMNTWIKTPMLVTNKTYNPYTCYDIVSEFCYDIYISVSYNVTSISHNLLINSSKEYQISSIHLYNKTQIMRLMDYPDVGKTFTGYYSPSDYSVWTDFVGYSVLTQIQLIILSVLISSLVIWQIICTIKIIYRNQKIEKVTLLNDQE